MEQCRPSSFPVETFLCMILKPADPHRSITAQFVPIRDEDILFQRLMPNPTPLMQKCCVVNCASQFENAIGGEPGANVPLNEAFQ